MTKIIDGEAVPAGGHGNNNKRSGVHEGRLEVKTARGSATAPHELRSRPSGRQGFRFGPRSDLLLEREIGPVCDPLSSTLFGPMSGPVVAIALAGMAHKHSMRTGADFPMGAIDLLSAQIEAGDPACAAFVTLLARYGGSDADPTTDTNMGGQRDA